MSKHIGSPPAATKFRSIAVIILVLVCIVAFWHYTEEWQGVALEAAKEKTIAEINTALSLTLYQAAIDSVLDNLPNLEGTNPFIYLSIYQSPPRNYFGRVNPEDSITRPGWYFVAEEGVLLYVDDTNQIEKYRVVFEFEDRNGTGRFEYGADKISGLSMKKAPSQ